MVCGEGPARESMIVFLSETLERKMVMLACQACSRIYAFTVHRDKYLCSVTTEGNEQTDQGHRKLWPLSHSFSVGTLTYASSLVPPGLFSNQIPGLENMVGSYGNGPFSCFHSNEHSDHLVASQLTAVSESDSVYKLRVRPWAPLERKLLSRLSQYLGDPQPLST